MRQIIFGGLIFIFFSSSVFQTEKPTLSKLLSIPCKKYCDAPQTVLTKEYSNKTLRLLFSIDRNCLTNDTINFQFTKDTLKIETLRNKRHRQDYAECECLFKYDLEIINVLSAPKYIIVNGQIHSDRLGFMYPSELQKGLTFLDSIESINKYPLDKFFLLPKFAANDLKSYPNYPMDFIKYLVINQFLKVELQGIVTKDESLDTSLPYKRAKALRDFLVGKKDICINRVVLLDSVGVLSKGSIGDISTIKVRLTSTKTFEQLPKYK